MNKEDKKAYATCPNCGVVLLKARNADGLEIVCGKCKHKYELRLTIGMVQVREMNVSYNVAS